MLIVSLSCGRGYTRDNDHTECVGGATQGTMIILSVCVGVCVCVDEWVNECVWVDLVEEQDSQQVLLLLRNKNVCIRYVNTLYGNIL